jgi:hypothetical protein
LLAASDKTTPAAKKLIASGEPIDQQDNEKLTALAHALQNQDLAAARLLMLGAHPDTRHPLWTHLHRKVQNQPKPSLLRSTRGHPRGRRENLACQLPGF